MPRPSHHDAARALAALLEPLARVAAGGELVDLTDDDIRPWMFWLGLDDVLHR